MSPLPRDAGLVASTARLRPAASPAAPSLWPDLHAGTRALVLATMLLLAAHLSWAASLARWPGDGSSIGATRTATVVITALGSRGDPIPGATVRLLAHRADGDAVVLEARTDARGQAVFDSAPPGRYRVSILFEGEPVLRNRRPLVVTPGETIRETYEVRFQPLVPARF